MLKFEFVVTGTELTDSQKEGIMSEFPALVTKALATQGADGAARFWCMCKVNGRSIFAHEHAVGPSEPAPQADRRSAEVTARAAADRPEVLVFELV